MSATQSLSSQPLARPIDPRQDWSVEGSRRKGGGSGGAYEGLPTHEPDPVVENGVDEPPHGMTLVTAKSTGKPRYCKKCRTVKPDRAHHCSTCGRCVLKMDHHCPWLATCVGLHNYKPFLLFLVYTSLFSWLCFFVSGSWVWAAILDDERMREGMVVVNTILLAVLGGIIGLVLSAFTGWHVYLAVDWSDYNRELRKDSLPESFEEVNGATIPQHCRPAIRRSRRHEWKWRARTDSPRAPEGNPRQRSSWYPETRGGRRIALPTAALRNQPSTAPQILHPRQRRIACSARTPASKLSESERDTLPTWTKRTAKTYPTPSISAGKRNLLHAFGTKPFTLGLTSV